MNRFMTNNSYYKNGRAVLFPVYKSSFERSDDTYEDILNHVGTTAHKDLMIMWVKDVNRCIDYLETRDEIDIDKIAYAGVSLGAANGAIIPAVEKRINLAILNVAGLFHADILPDATGVSKPHGRDHEVPRSHVMRLK